VARRVGRRCRFLGANGRLGALRPCARPVYLAARTRFVSRTRDTRWSFFRAASLASGRYLLMVRGINRLGELERNVAARSISLRRR
jgi:hypothetical protein